MFDILINLDNIDEEKLIPEEDIRPLAKVKNRLY